MNWANFLVRLVFLCFRLWMYVASVLHELASVTQCYVVHEQQLYSFAFLSHQIMTLYILDNELAAVPWEARGFTFAEPNSRRRNHPFIKRSLIWRPTICGYEPRSSKIRALVRAYMDLRCLLSEWPFGYLLISTRRSQNHPAHKSLICFYAGCSSWSTCRGFR